MADQDVMVTVTINADANRVWGAMTDPALVEQWMMGAKVDSTWRQGDPITWSGEYNGQRYTDTGEIVEVDPGRRLVHTHSSTMSPDRPAHTVTWSIDDAGNGTTRLGLTQDGASSDEEAAQFTANWASMLSALGQMAER